MPRGDGFRGRRATAAAAGHEEQVRLSAIGAHHRGQQAVRVGAVLQDRRARAVAEQHAGVAVLPIDDGGELLRADDQDGVVGAGHDELLGDFQAVDEARAGGLQVEGGGAVRADLSLHQAGGGGKGHVRRDGGHDDQVDLLGGDAGALHGAQGGLRAPGRR